MTITYSNKVASVSAFGVFWKLLFRWHGSVYKHIWPEFIVYVILYLTSSLIYSFGLGEEGKKVYADLSSYANSYKNSVPMTFVLGFYVNLVVTRWWGQYKSLPWPDTLAILVSESIKGRDVKTRLMRRTIMRYANLSYVLALRAISPSVLSRFPTLEEIVLEGFLKENEKALLEKAAEESGGSYYWVPIVWATSIVESARRELYINNDLSVREIVRELAHFRGCLGALLGYDRISIPLAYTQVVTMAVYSYLLASLFSRQFLQKQEISLTSELYFPLLSFLQIVMYLGWLKVAEQLVNPFGNDDEDFDINGLIDRNRQVSFMIIDKMLDAHPELSEDKQWDEIFHNQELVSAPHPTYRCEEINSLYDSTVRYHKLTFIDDP